MLDNKSLLYSTSSTVAEDLNATKEKFTCEICYDEFELDQGATLGLHDKDSDLENNRTPISNLQDRPQVLALKGCGHTFCLECWQETYTSYIQEQFRYSDLKCLQAGCDCQPTDQELQVIVGPEVYQKYTRFCNNNRVAKDKNLMFCLRPGCEEVLDVRNFKNQKQMTCTKCDIVICKKCRQCHEGSKCGGGQHDDLNDLGHWVGSKSSSLVSNCPKCGTLTEKNQGCSHMRCTICKYEYCWICGCNLNGFHERLLEGFCQYWNESWQKNKVVKLLIMTFGPIFFYIMGAIVGIFTMLIWACKTSTKNLFQYNPILTFVQFLVQLIICIALATIGYCLVAVFALIMLILYYPLFLIWCCLIGYRNCRCRRLKARKSSSIFGKRASAISIRSPLLQDQTNDVIEMSQSFDDL